METMTGDYDTLEECMKESKRMQGLRKRLAYHYEEAEREEQENEYII